jgi:hypothetical protein
MSVKVILRVTPMDYLPEVRLSADVMQAVDLSVHLLKPASLAVFLLAFWRFSADLGWTSEFLFTDGILSHWQLWFAIGCAMLASESALSRRLAKG